MAKRSPAGQRKGNTTKRLNKDGTSNRNMRTPSLKENVGKSVRADAKAVKKAITKTPGPKAGSIKPTVVRAGARAASRIASRAGLVGVAGSVGVGVGTALNKVFGISNQIVDANRAVPDAKSLGKMRFTGASKSSTKARPMPKPKATATSTPAKKSSGRSEFGAAFAKARKSGVATFTHKGKSFSTATKDDVKKSGSKNLREHLNKKRKGKK